MELKHLRKGKIVKVPTADLENELKKIEIRVKRYNAVIEEFEPLRKILHCRLVENGVGIKVWRGSENWSVDQEDHYRVSQNVNDAMHAIDKIKEKTKLIEEELLDRILTDNDDTLGRKDV